MVELASGVDALYLSGRADLSPTLVATLEERRATAAETGTAAPIVLDGETFGVQPHSFGKHRFCLDHEAGRVGVTTSEHIPALRVQPRAELLHGVGPRVALGFFDQIGEYLAGGPVRWGLSRLDLFCDVQGWELTGDDRHNFVCRGQRRDTHEESEEFTGLEFGRRSTKTVCGRIYDKTRQVQDKGIDWWFEKWGDRFDRSRPVLRTEIEIGRQGLVEFGVDTPTDGLEAVGRLWASTTETWLTYRTPTADETKSRWPVAPEWAAIQRASLRGDAIGIDRVRAGQKRGDLRKLTPALVGYLARAAQIMGTSDLTSTLAAVRYIVANDEERRGVSFEDRVAALVEEARFR